MTNEFCFTDFDAFMFTLNDLNESLAAWGKNPDNTWDMDIYIGEGKYYIYIEIDENKNKSE